MGERKNTILIGCVADDFTGASDAASFLAKSGLRTLLVNGIPADELLAEKCDAVVIGLKTRSVSPQDAVQQTLTALRWLERAGTEQFYIKYCSTFDSTPAGNIGPVVDAAMEELGTEETVLCPSLPVNGRTVKNGCLYVNGIPLHESSMKNHPLNPMWASSIPELMRPQGKHSCVVISGEELVSGRAPFSLDSTVPRYLIPDYETDLQGERIAERFGHLRLLTGGSGLLEHLARRARRGGGAPPAYQGTSGRALMLCGSCSHATGQQIRRFLDNGGRHFAVEGEKLLAGQQTADMIWDFIAAEADTPTLVYSTGAQENSRQEELEAKRISACLEATMARVGQRAADSGFTRIIVAGGETSGAVMVALGLDAYYIGPSVAPGVPVLTPVNNQNMRIVLKSGNFGQEDFFARALAMTAKDGAES